jgi:hypothetical protein
VLGYEAVERYPTGFIHLDELHTELPAFGPTDDTQVDPQGYRVAGKRYCQLKGLSLRNGEASTFNQTARACEVQDPPFSSLKTGREDHRASKRNAFLITRFHVILLLLMSVLSMAWARRDSINFPHIVQR